MNSGTHPTVHETTRDYLDLLETIKTVAVAGASSEPLSPGWRTALGLHGNGVKVYFIAPGAGDRLGIKSVATLSQVTANIDLLDCWGDTGDLSTIICDAIRRKIRVIWLEPNMGTLSDEIEALLSQAEIQVIRHKSLYAEYLLSYSCA